MPSGTAHEGCQSPKGVGFWLQMPPVSPRYACSPYAPDVVLVEAGTPCQCGEVASKHQGYFDEADILGPLISNGQLRCMGFKPRLARALPVAATFGAQLACNAPGCEFTTDSLAQLLAHDGDGSHFAAAVNTVPAPGDWQAGPFKCSGCPLTTSTVEALAAHVITSHPGSALVELTMADYPCQDCHQREPTPLRAFIHHVLTGHSFSPHPAPGAPIPAPALTLDTGLEVMVGLYEQLGAAATEVTALVGSDPRAGAVPDISARIAEMDLHAEVNAAELCVIMDQLEGSPRLALLTAPAATEGEAAEAPAVLELDAASATGRVRCSACGLELDVPSGAPAMLNGRAHPDCSKGGIWQVVSHG